METQKIANYEQRMQAYRKERRHLLLFEAPWIIILGVGTAMGMLYLLNLSAPPGAIGDWRLLGLLMGLGLSWPPIDMMLPKKPNPGDVAHDQALRCAFRMDDTVDDDGRSQESSGGGTS